MATDTVNVVRLFRFGLRRSSESLGPVDPPADWILSNEASSGFVRLVRDDDTQSIETQSSNKNSAGEEILHEESIEATVEHASPSLYEHAGTPAQTADRMLPALRFERAVFALAHRTEILADRFERMEQRLETIVDQLFEGATQIDLLDLEARRARLAAEVARMNVELRAELDQGLSKLTKDMTRLMAPVTAPAEKATQKNAQPVAFAATIERVPAAHVPSVTTPPYHYLELDTRSLSALSMLDTLPGEVLDRPGPFSLL